MGQVRLRVSAAVVTAAATGGAVLVVICEFIALAVGVERAVRSSRTVEGIVIAGTSTMIAALSVAVLLFIAWRVAEPTTRDREGRPTTQRTG